MTDHIEESIVDYYSDKVRRYGPTNKGVDWNSVESQTLRFHQFARLFEGYSGRISLLDFGCGWGGLLNYVEELSNHLEFDYSGFDIVPAMLEHARSLFGNRGTWLDFLRPDASFDFLVASGVFNVRQHHSDVEWLSYIKSTLTKFNELAREGFAFNVLSNSADPKLRRDYLYYADSTILLDFCKQSFSSHVVLLHDYPLFEFTLVVKKNHSRENP